MPSDPFQGVNQRVSGFTVSEVSAVDTMFSMLLLWQWDFQGSAMPCPSKALEYSLFFWLTETFPDNKLVYISNCSRPGMFLPLALLLKYWIKHVTIGLLHVNFIVSTRILYKGVPGLATDYPCGVWYCGLTTCIPPVCWSTFWNTVLNYS